MQSLSIYNIMWNKTKGRTAKNKNDIFFYTPSLLHNNFVVKI